jgi:hypothetical protein
MKGRNDVWDLVPRSADTWTNALRPRPDPRVEELKQRATEAERLLWASLEKVPKTYDNFEIIMAMLAGTVAEMIRQRPTSDGQKRELKLFIEGLKAEIKSRNGF